MFSFSYFDHSNNEFLNASRFGTTMAPSANLCVGFFFTSYYFFTVCLEELETPVRFEIGASLCLAPAIKQSQQVNELK